MKRLVVISSIALISLVVVALAGARPESSRTYYVGSPTSLGTISSSYWSSTSSYAYRDTNDAVFSGACLGYHQWLRVRYVSVSGSLIRYNDAPRGTCQGQHARLGIPSGQYAKAQVAIMVDPGWGPVSRSGIAYSDWH